MKLENTQSMINRTELLQKSPKKEMDIKAEIQKQPFVSTFLYFFFHSIFYKIYYTSDKMKCFQALQKEKKLTFDENWLS